MMKDREIIQLQREVRARLVPSGMVITIPEGLWVTLTQALGNSFTVICRGSMARIEGYDADALDKAVPISEFPTPDDGSISKDQVWESMSQVYDPEIDVNVVDLGLIYECTIDQGAHHVAVVMTLTSPGCGMGPVIQDDIHNSILRVPHVESVNVEITFEPAWSQEMLTDEAKLEFGFI